MDRRSFLRGASACAIAAVVPAPAVPETYGLWLFEEEARWQARALMASPSFQHGLIFDGMVGVYNGVIIRQVDMIETVARTVEGATWG